MSDRELLELAAKAAGYTLGSTTLDDDYWNPLTDDGDALRLAVKLNMQIVITGYELEGVGITDCKAFSGNWVGGSLHHNDPLAATRRAIVGAAAEIGRGIAQKAASTDLPEDNYYKSMAEAEEIGRAAAEIGRQMP